ncbi:hypothetical protein CDQ83_09765 [Clostridium thermosuccinogenes]|nr:hypothetical protein CDQ83_09765 [Pseudoclostridium thermosuccinogenes]
MGSKNTERHDTPSCKKPRPLKIICSRDAQLVSCTSCGMKRLKQPLLYDVDGMFISNSMAYS